MWQQFCFCAGVGALCLSSVPKQVAPDCTFGGKPLWGRVKVIEPSPELEDEPDFRVQRVEQGEDLRVQWVTHEPVTCGQWRRVEERPDFEVVFVDEGPDLRVRMVNQAPGLRR